MNNFEKRMYLDYLEKLAPYMNLKGYEFDEVLDTFVKVSKKYIGNPNSLHKLGVETKNIIDAATKIASCLILSPDIIDKFLCKKVIPLTFSISCSTKS